MAIREDANFQHQIVSLLEDTQHELSPVISDPRAMCIADTGNNAIKKDAVTSQVTTLASTGLNPPQSVIGVNAPDVFQRAPQRLLDQLEPGCLWSDELAVRTVGITQPYPGDATAELSDATNAAGLSRFG